MDSRPDPINPVAKLGEARPTYPQTSKAALATTSTPAVPMGLLSPFPPFLRIVAAIASTSISFSFACQPVFAHLRKILDLPFNQVPLPTFLPFIPTATIFPVFPITPEVFPNFPIAPVHPAVALLPVFFLLPEIFPLFPVFDTIQICHAITPLAAFREKLPVAPTVAPTPVV